MVKLNSMNLNLSLIPQNVFHGKVCSRLCTPVIPALWLSWENCFEFKATQQDSVSNKKYIQMLCQPYQEDQTL